MKGVTLLVLFAIILHGGCKKANLDDYGDVTIAGTLVRDCSLQGLSGYKLRFTTTDPGISGKNITELGSVTTGADGKFSIKIKNLNPDDLKLWYMPTDDIEDGNSIVESYRWPQRPETGKAYDWGYVFLSGLIPEVHSKLNVKSSAGQGTDSIYIGTSSKSYQAIKPTPSGEYLEIKLNNFPGTTSELDSLPVIWAKSKIIYDSAMRFGASRAGAYKADVPFFYCNTGQPVDFYIK